MAGSPSVPTPTQIRETHKAVSELYPNARIVRVGPEGITFEYPDGSKPDGKAYVGRPFSDQS